MIIKDDAVIEFKIYYKGPDKKYDAFTESELKLELKNAKMTEIEKEALKILNVKMKELTWGMYNDFQEQAMVDDGSGTGNRYFNFKRYKEHRLKTLIAGWDALDENNKPIPVSDKIIGRLAPSIAEAILRAYDEMAYLTDGEEKNL